MIWYDGDKISWDKLSIIHSFLGKNWFYLDTKSWSASLRTRSFSELCGRSSLTCTWKLWLDRQQDICMCYSFPRILSARTHSKRMPLFREEEVLLEGSPVNMLICLIACVSIYTLDFHNMLWSISIWSIFKSMQSKKALDFPLRSPIPTMCIWHAMFQSILFYYHFCAHLNPVPGTVPVQCNLQVADVQSAWLFRFKCTYILIIEAWFETYSLRAPCQSSHLLIFCLP